jgi:hypothetical protein
MEFYEQPDFNPGAMLDRFDPRDFQWDEFASSYPPFNWEEGFEIEEKLQKIIHNTDGSMSFRVPIKNQASSFSCGGQSKSYYGEILEALATGTFEERSAKFIYAQTFIPGQGSSMRDNANLVVKQGWAKEALVPSYQNGLPPSEMFMQRSQDISDFARLDAKRARALSYVYVQPDIDLVAQAMAANNGMEMLITGSNNGTWGSPTPKLPGTEATWRHFMYGGKAYLKNGKKTIEALQSWGKNVGKDGWQEFDETWFTHGAILAVITHLFNPEPMETFHHQFLKNLMYGELNDEVIQLQKALQLTGDFPANVPTARRYGDVTRRAVLKFQLREKVDAVDVLIKLNGQHVGVKTRQKLNVLFA